MVEAMHASDAESEAISLRGDLPPGVDLPPFDADDDLLASAASRQAILDSFYDRALNE